MTRIEVTAVVSNDLLVLVGPNGEEVRRFEPQEVAYIGSTIGGYIVGPVFGDEKKWGFWRIGGSLMRQWLNYSDEEWYKVSRHTRRNAPQSVVEGGERYLLATSAGSARNGVLHPVPKHKQTPLQKVLRSRGYSPGKVVQHRSGVTAPVYTHCYHENPQYHADWMVHGETEFRHDGEVEVLERKKIGKHAWEEKVRIKNPTYVYCWVLPSRKRASSSLGFIHIFTPEGEKEVTRQFEGMQ